MCIQAVLYKDVFISAVYSLLNAIVCIIKSLFTSIIYTDTFFIEVNYRYVIFSTNIKNVKCKNVNVTLA